MGLGISAFVLFWLLILLVPIGGFGIALWVLIDAFKRPEWAWQAAGENREMYLALLGTSLVMCQPLGWIPALMYFMGAKARVVAAEAMMPPATPGFRGYPPQSYYGAAPGGAWQAGGQPPPPGQHQGNWPANPGAAQPPPPGQSEPGNWPANPGDAQPSGPSYEPPRYDLPETPPQKGPFD